MPINLTVTQPAPVSLSYVEAAIKPEVTGHVTPTYEQQTVYPAAGTTFGSVEVDAIPDPTAIKEIDSNGDHDVRRYGTARVDVQPKLQHREATPNRQTQNIEAEANYDGLSGVTVNPIPSQYIIPEGSLDITQNANGIDVTDKASVNVNVPIPPEYIIPTGTKPITGNGTGINVREFERVDVDVSDKPDVGFTLSGWDNTGRPTTATTFGFASLPAWYLWMIGYNRYNRTNWNSKLTTIILNEGLVTINENAFRDCYSVTHIYFPSTLTTLSGSYIWANVAAQLLDFSKCASVVILSSIAGNGLPSGCVIRVPQSLLAEWQEQRTGMP